MTSGIYVRTEQHRRHLSDAWDYDKHFTEQCRKNMKKCHIPMSEETKIKLRKPKVKSHIAWNKGLTRDTDKRVKQCSDKCAETMSTVNWKYSTGRNNLSNALKLRRQYLIFPKKDTSIEVKIQNLLKQLCIEFLTHQYMHIEHGYQCDILIPVQKGIERKIIIEAFGTYWHKYPLGREIDTQRCKELREAGWRVLIFWENEIHAMELNDLCKKVIRK